MNNLGGVRTAVEWAEGCVKRKDFTALSYRWWDSGVYGVRSFAHVMRGRGGEP